MSRSPNTALQRTRSAPLRSPLSFRTFGATPRTVFAATLMTGMALVGCETVNGKAYWVFTAPPFLVSSSCQRQTADIDETLIVEVRDESRAVMPGVIVKFTHSAVEAAEMNVTNAAGIARARLGPGSWRVETSLFGFRPAHYTVELPKNQVCTVKFVIRVDPKIVVA